MVALASLVLVALSGLWLLIGYEGARAHDSIKDLLAVTPLGGVMRSLHLLSANLLLLTLGGYLVALLFTRVAVRPAAGLLTMAMLLVAVAMSCSGEALPWDRQARVAADVATSLGASVPVWGAIQRVIRGGVETGAATRKRLHYIHLLPLPLPLLGLLLLIGRFRVGRGEGTRIEGPPTGTKLLERPELALGLATAVGLILAAALWRPGLGPSADATLRITPAKAPWFLAGWQEASSYAPGVGPALFGLLLVALLLAPFIAAPVPGRGGRLRLAAGPGAFGGVALVTSLAVWWWRDPSFGAPSALNPATIALGATAALAVLAWWTQGRDRAAAFRAALAGLIGVVVVLTAVGWLLRGPDWQLGWHPGQGIVGEAIVPAATLKSAESEEAESKREAAE